MMKFLKNKNYTTRKIHRYLGLFLGIQFLFWTLGGLYFSWNNMDDVHGETLLRKDKSFFKEINFSNIQKGVESLKSTNIIDSIYTIKIVEILNNPFAQFRYFEKGHLKSQLINLQTGELRPPLTIKEGEKIVEGKLKNHIPIIKTEFLTKQNVNSHHEYREKPLPAYVYTLGDTGKTKVYVSANSGEISSVRNNNWRRFDFLWMLHTMDYDTRDNITNWVLRIFSIFGLITVLSGFYLFYLSSMSVKKIRKHFTKL